MQQELEYTLSTAKAIEALLHPHAEVVVHDLATHKIVAIFNGFSGRKVGDPSLLEREANLKTFPDYFEPYYTTNWDGRKLKSTTATLRDRKGHPVGLMCINLDITHMDQLQHIIAAFTDSHKEKKVPRELFQDDWRDKITLYVHRFKEEQGSTLKRLSKEDKKTLVYELHREGAFRAKHAAAHVGQVLGLSRATVYKYLAEINGR